MQQDWQTPGLSKGQGRLLPCGKTYAEIALRINPTDSDANCSMAMALGRSSMSKSGKEKVANAKEVKKNMWISLFEAIPKTSLHCTYLAGGIMKSTI